MQGNWNHYRCTCGSEYARSAQLDHPKVVYLRERDLLPHVDAWLGRLFDPEHVDETFESILGAAAANQAAELQRATVNEELCGCDQKLDSYRQLLETGTDAALVAGWIKRRAGRAPPTRSAAAQPVGRDRCRLRHGRRDPPHSREARRDGRATAGDAAKAAQPLLRGGRAHRDFDPTTRSIEAVADLGVRKVRVGGGDLNSCRRRGGSWYVVCARAAQRRFRGPS